MGILTELNDLVDPGRQYFVVIKNWKGEVKFVSFYLPVEDDHDNVPLNNKVAVAQWYYLNRLDFTSMVLGCYPETLLREVKYLSHTPKEDKKDG